MRRPNPISTAAAMVVATLSLALGSPAHAQYGATADALTYVPDTVVRSYRDSSNTLISSYDHSRFENVSVCNGTTCTGNSFYFTNPVVTPLHDIAPITATASSNRTGYVDLFGDISHPAAAASASADLASGTLHEGVSTTSGDGTIAKARASLYDSLVFNVVGDAPVTATALFHIDGTFERSVTIFDFRFGNSSGQANYNSSGSSTTANPETYLVNFLGAGWTVLDPENFQMTFMLHPGLNPMIVAMSLRSEGYYADFQHTAGFSLTLPEGVSFTSDSGVFLTATGGGVPEPATWAMMLLGFGAVGAAVRSRRRSLAAV